MIQKKNILRPMIVTAVLLMIPLIAMQFTSEVNWDLSDFVIMGILLFVTGLIIEFVMVKMGRFRAVAVLAVLAGFLWLWAELAVGVFTNWGS